MHLLTVVLGDSVSVPRKAHSDDLFGLDAVCLNNSCHLNVTLGDLGACFFFPPSRFEINVYSILI